MFELDEIIRSGLTMYLLVVGLVTLDAILPTAPSETLLVATGVLAADGNLSAPALIGAGACGALLGHSILFAIGRGTGPHLRARLLRSLDAQVRLNRAAAVLHERTWLLVVADFVPWGRTALMYSAGGLGLPTRRFYAFVIPGALVWSSFYVMLGVLGGTAFERSWQALVVSLAAAVLIAAAAELYHRRHRTLDG